MGSEERMMIKDGTWCVYRGKEYKAGFSFCTEEDIEDQKESIERWEPSFYERYYKYIPIEPGDIELTSSDREDLENGFVPYYDRPDEFSCIKVVHKSEITKAYRYDPYVIYRDIKCLIRSFDRSKNRYYLETYFTINPDKLSNIVMIAKLAAAGFDVGLYEKYWGWYYEKYVSPDDPDLQIIEQRKEIDVNIL